jgi:hypothetical protein
VKKSINILKKNKKYRIKFSKLNSQKKKLIFTKSVFGNIVAVAFQIAFHAKIHVNDIFFIF